MKLKKYFLVVIYFCSQLEVSSQIFHTKKTSQDENLAFTFEDKFGNFVSCGTYFDSDIATSVNNWRGFIYKLNSNGELLKQKKIEFGSDIIFFTSGIEVDDGYLFFGSRKYSNGDSYSYIIKTNYELNIILEKRIGQPSQYDNVIHSSCLQNNDTLILGANNVDQSGSSIMWTATIYKLNLDLDLINSKTFITPNTDGSSIIMSVIPLKNNMGYKISSRYDFQGLVGSTGGELFRITIDNNFNVISSKYNTRFIPSNTLNNITNSVADLHWLNDSIYVIGIQGLYWEPPIDVSKSGNDVVTLYFDAKKDSLIHYNILGKKDSSDIANVSNISVLNDSIIYSSGTHRMTYNYMYNTETTWLMANKQKYSSTGVTTEWEYFYGGDARYKSMHVLATKDGGCLLTARRYDTSGVYKSDVFFLKIQSDGTLYPVGGIDKKIKKETISIFPNPSSDFITAAFPNNTYSEIGLISHNGNTIFKNVLKQNLTELKIDCNAFSAGTYLLYLKEKESSLSIAKKIVIQH